MAKHFSQCRPVRIVAHYRVENGRAGGHVLAERTQDGLSDLGVAHAVGGLERVMVVETDEEHLVRVGGVVGERAHVVQQVQNGFSVATELNAAGFAVTSSYLKNE